ncbi:UNVERIFIED_CONTAM: GDSL esterase/lipase [Sesamum angustifolium]|uniref:GDSL esterase/lipase n=1 Tax=Sesamum angustifolium TaxID=2727405 RepID=A0AAW2P9F6_9LAMI
MALITIAKWMTSLSIFLSLAMKPIHGQQQQVPCLFFLGDSQFDNGNNNLLLTSAKANYPPYGIDYADGATGRFSNGRNIADYLAQLLGFEKPVPPFATARGSDIIKGVNYASGGAGILAESGIQLGDRISLDRQLLNHRLTIARLSLLLSKQSSSVLKSLIDSLNTDLPNAQFIYINITSISSGDPSVIGIRVVNAPCCVVSRRTGQCAPNQVPCSNRNEYAFWDNFHPTEILNLVTASRAYNATEPTDAYPVDIRRLVQQ